MTPEEQYVLAVAMAINGPHDAMPTGSRYSLTDLRHARWKMLRPQEQKYRLWQARAAIAQCKVTEPNGWGDYPAAGLKD